jgi:hypothetical protein
MAEKKHPESNKENNAVSRREALKLLGAVTAFGTVLGMVGSGLEAADQIAQNQEKPLERQHKEKWLKQPIYMKFYHNKKLVYSVKLPDRLKNLYDQQAQISIKMVRGDRWVKITDHIQQISVKD